MSQYPRLVFKGAQSYEPRYVELLRACVGRDDTVFDLGANIGFYTVLFARWAKQVVAYEPDPSNVELLRHNLHDNGGDAVLIRPVALADAVGDTTSRRDLVTGHTGHLGSGATYSDSIHPLARHGAITVRTETVDAEVACLGVAPDILKVDVEESEHEVLRGARDTLARHRPAIVSEFSTWNVHGGAERAGAALDLLRDLQYSAWDIDHGRPARPGETWMFVAVPQERMSEERTVRLLAAIPG